MEIRLKQKGKSRMAEQADTPSKTINVESPEYYINRELSMLQFQWRVFDEARDERNPLLERIRFLTIVDSNLDEFFMVRVGGLRMQRDAGIIGPTDDGTTPSRLLASIRKEAIKLLEDCRRYLREVLLPELHQNGIRIMSYSDLSVRQKEAVNDYFNEVIFPVLTPLAVDPGHPFPHISNLSLNLAIHLKDKDGRRHFARLKIPPSLPQLVPVKRSSGGTRRDGTVPHTHVFVWITHAIIANIQRLFPGMEVLEAHQFHVTRNADMEIQEIEAIDLLDTIEESVRKRRFGTVVRLMINKTMPTFMKEFLAENLRVEMQDVYALTGPLDLSGLVQLTRIERHELKYPPFTPSVPTVFKVRPELDDGSIFGVIRNNSNILLHHPYDSFSPVVEFLNAAAHDPNVMAIKQTLYRAGTNSPVVKALLTAARDYGKQVAVLVELKARFDEESNIGWAKMLEQEGVHVIYGLLGLKTHSKIAMVVRREGDHIRRYVHLGTGNYNHQTATVYEDIGMFTCDEEIGADVSDLFNYLTGYSAKADYRKLLVAPINLRQRIEERIEREIEYSRQGEKGRLIFKFNHLVDKPMVHLLYRASQAGVKIDLLVRGMCSLKPGIPGLSDNIRVVSVVGRFLEHSRIYYFRNGGDEKILMGSADLMPRNLNQRVEVLFEVEDPKNVRYLRDEVLATYMKDNLKSRLMLPDGSYKRLKPGENDAEICAQDALLLSHGAIQPF
jgi:polyphosphate kinase